MGKRDNKITRRDFIKTTGAGLAGAALLSGSLSSMGRSEAFAAPLEFPIEKDAELRVLRWAEFVKGDHVLWEENTKKFTATERGKSPHRVVILGRCTSKVSHGGQCWSGPGHHCWVV